jgi:hypothetical protein
LEPASVFPTSSILVALMMVALSSFILLFLQEPHDLTSQAFFIFTAVKTSNLLKFFLPVCLLRSELTFVHRTIVRTRAIHRNTCKGRMKHKRLSRIT